MINSLNLKICNKKVATKGNLFIQIYELIFVNNLPVFAPGLEILQAWFFGKRRKDIINLKQ
jgi:hypothetical protein